MTRHSRWACLLPALMLVAGCDEIEVNVGENRPQKPVRAAPEPVHRRTPASQPAAASQPARDATIEPTYYQIVLTSDAVPPDSPAGIQFVHLNCASPRALGNVLSTIYLASGASGSSSRYTLIYALRAESAAAAGHITTLDVPAAAPGAGKAAGFACALASLYLLERETLNADRARTIVEQFEAVADSESSGAWERWAANVIAASTSLERLSDFTRAARRYARAADLAPPGSIEHMTALYGQGHALLQAGRNSDARRVLQTLLGQFGAMRGSEPFERTRRLLSELERRR